MIELKIPGRDLIQVHHLVCDVNGTLALDGQLIRGVGPALAALSDKLQLHLLTADTHGRQDDIDRQLATRAVRIPPGHEAVAKGEYVRRLGVESVVAIGQGANDAEMLRLAAIGVCVLSPEGTAVEAMMAADLLAPDILSAFEMLQNPLRIVAGLRR